MGIKDLSRVIEDHSSSAVKLNEMKNYFGRKIAIDASMCLYQFLIAVRQDGNQLQSHDGQTTSHLMGMFYRTIHMIENGIKPVFVFDGKPPQMKSNELNKRMERRIVAEKSLSLAVEEGDSVSVEKFEKRLVKVTKEQNDEAKKLLKLMGIPIIEAACEAEAQCAALVRQGHVYATASEDMDALTFGSNVLLRQMLSSEAKKLPIKEINLSTVLNELGLNMAEFIDLCILLGCDYTSTIRGIGPKKAFELIKKCRNIEAILDNLDTHVSISPFSKSIGRDRGDLSLANKTITLLNYSRSIRFRRTGNIKKRGRYLLVWSDPEEESIVKFLCGEKSFNETRIRGSLLRMKKGRHSSQQGRIDSFFLPCKVISSEPTNSKRKAIMEASKKGKKKDATTSKRVKK